MLLQLTPGKVEKKTLEKRIEEDVKARDRLRGDGGFHESGQPELASPLYHSHRPSFPISLV